MALANIRFQFDTAIHSGFPIFFWVKPRIDTTHIPDQSNKVVIVTGGNSGTGYITCQTFYNAGAKVYMASRSRQRAEEAIKNIKNGYTYSMTGLTKSEQKKKGEGSLEFLELDLSDLASVERFAEEFKGREKRLDILFANAGVMASPEGMYTKQGYTLQFGTNCLGHQRLISLLLPLLQSTSSTSSSPARLITTSSAGHAGAPPNGVDYKSVIRDTSSSDLSSGKKGRNERMKWVEYGQSKWGNIAIAIWVHSVYGPAEGRRFGKETIQKKSGDGEVISISLHPGCVATNLAQHLWLTPYITKYAPWAFGLVTKPPSDGASNQIWAATCPDAQAKKLSGEYIVPFQRIGIARPDLEDFERLDELWNWCEEQGKKAQ